MQQKFIIIPLGGIGNRFKKENYKNPKALIKINNKCIIYWLLDNIKISNDYTVLIPYNEKEYKEIKKKYVEDIKYYLNSKNIYHEGVNIIDFIDIYHDGDSLIVNLDTNLLSNLIYSKNVTVQSNQITTEKQKEDIIKKVEEVKPPTENGNYSLNPVNGQLTNEEIILSSNDDIASANILPIFDSDPYALSILLVD